jgi:HEPN domain-containing protein
MRPLTQEWIDKAEGDYRVASAQWQSAEPVWDAICLHAEQCAEKYLKAWLVEHDLGFPKTHDLEVLARLCIPSLGEVAGLMDGLAFLTSSAVEVRYPGMFARRDDAQKCLDASQDVRNLVQAKLGAGTTR